MKNERLKQVHATLAFLRSVILNGEPMTAEVRAAINEAIDNIRKVDTELLILVVSH